MARITLAGKVLFAGYSDGLLDEGYSFYAGGDVLRYEWGDEDWPVPRFDKLPKWRVSASSEDFVSRHLMLVDQKLGYKETERTKYLRSWRSEFGVCNALMSTFEGRVYIDFSFPPDPIIPNMIMTAMSSERFLEMECGGFHFLAEDKPAPAVSMIGFKERDEPAFAIQKPSLRIRWSDEIIL